MVDDERGEGTSASAGAAAATASLFKKRSKPRGNGVGVSASAASSPAPQHSSRKTLLQSNEEEGDDDDGEGDGLSAAVLRTSASGRGRIRGTQAPKERNKASALRFSTTAASSLANSEDDDDGPGFALRKDAIARSYGDDDALLRSLQQQATIGGNDSTHSPYTPAVLAELKASTSNLAQNGKATTAHTHIVDPSTQTDEAGDSLTRMKFAADFAHDGIPSEAVINAAKERRRRAVADEAPPEDFISLRDNDPHPESRLQREEDEEGSGEDDFAQFTGATERVALNTDGIEREKARERERRREAMELDEGGSSSNDSEREWERAQMGRVQGANLQHAAARRKHSRHREASPFQAASIPQAIPLPTLTATSTRLQERKTELQQAMYAQEQLQHDATTKLEQLRLDEERNRSQTQDAAKREAWFREFSQFVHSMALFLEEKMPRLQNVEVAWRDHLTNRTRTIQRARADALTDQLALFYGVPARSLDIVREQVSDDFNQVEEARLPSQDGDALSEVRLARRVTAAEALSGELSPADQANFAAARTEVARRATYLLDDVQAAEYREPAPRIANGAGDAGTSTTTMLHPSSLVARFHRWRRMFPDEYHNAWGGLTLASVWDFWIRRSLCGWDGLRVATRQPRDLDGFAWYVELAHYAAKASKVEGRQEGVDEGANSDDDMNNQQALGGDDEVLAHALTNTLVPVLIKTCEQGGFDPWSASDHAGAMDIVEQTSYVLETDNVRFQSLVAAFVRSFEPHVAALADALTLPPALAAPAMSPDAPPALLAFVQYISDGLLRHLLAWHRFTLAAHRPLLSQLVHTLVENVLLPLLGMTQHTAGGAQVAHSIATDVLHRTSRSGLLRDTLREQLQRLVH